MPRRCDVAEKRVRLILTAVAAILLVWAGWHVARLGQDLVRLLAAESASGHPILRFFERE